MLELIYIYNYLADDSNYAVVKHWLPCLHENGKKWLHRKDTGNSEDPLICLVVCCFAVFMQKFDSVHLNGKISTESNFRKKERQHAFIHIGGN